LPSSAQLPRNIRTNPNPPTYVAAKPRDFNRSLTESVEFKTQEERPLTLATADYRSLQPQLQAGARSIEFKWR
jgi:hypothetical protein